MKRIALITPCILPVPATLGGAVEGLITRIVDDNELNSGFNIDLFTLSDEGESCVKYSFTEFFCVRNGKVQKLSDRVIDKLYRTFPCGSSRRLLDRRITELFSDRLNEIDGGYDAVIVENMMSTAVALVHYCQGKYEFPFYFHMHNDVDIYRSPEYIRDLVRNGVRFIAVSGYIKNQILRYASDATVDILYNGVALTDYNPSEKSSDILSFLYAGRIIPDKGVKELVTAFNMFTDALEASQQKNYSLEIIGFSGFDKGYESEVRKLSEQNKQISLHEQISGRDLVKRYDLADVIIIPSLVEESFGMVALESMAMGKVIISSDSGALPEVLGDSAIIVDKSRDFPGHLCEAIKRISMDGNLRSELAESAYNRARKIKDFDISIYYSNFRRIIDGRKPEGKISVVVPVYNVEAYLSECIDSLIAQEYSNLEIILVNDGSTDSSETICREYAAKDARIKIISQANGGLSAARNTGIDNATGDYVFFCDSDDSLRKDALLRLINKAEDTGSDVVACGIANVWYGNDGKVEKTEAFTSPHPGMWSGRQSVVEMMRSNNVCTVACNKLFKRTLFDDIRFTVGVLHEDEAVMYKLLYKAGLVSYIPDLLYNYRQRSGSIMQGDLTGRYQYGIKALSDRRIFFEQNGEKELAEHSQISLLEQIKYSYRYVSSTKDKEDIKEIYARELREGGAPGVMGMKKKLALIFWRYIKY